jgi:hypothetical protein
LTIKLSYFNSIVLRDIIHYTAIFLSLFFPFCVIVTSLLMLEGSHFSVIVPLFSFVLCVIILFLGIPKENRQVILTGILILLILIVSTSFLLGGLFFDTSYDGQDYHQEGVIQIMKNWNPYAKGNTLTDNFTSFRIEHYPQGDVFALCSIFVFFKNNIEVVKGLNFLMGICAFILLVKALLYILPGTNKIQRWLVVLLAFVIVLNPVAIVQWFTFYHDGRLFYETVILVSLIIIYHFRQNILLRTAIITNIIFLINIKFNGIWYAFLSCGLYILFELINKQWRKAIRFSFLSLLAAIVAFGIVGYGSYVKNLTVNKHPLYPIMGPGNMTNDVVKQLAPKNFNSLNNFEKFCYSYTAFPIWSRSPLNSQQRGLFSLCDVSYYEQYNRPDTEMNGFGVFFAELILLALGALILGSFIRRKPPSFFFIWIIFFFLIISICSNPLSLIARFSPELWLLPVVPIFGLILLNRKFLNIYVFILLILLLTNSVLIAVFNIKSAAKSSKLVSEQLIDLKKQDKPIIISAKWSSFTERLSEHNVKFIRVDWLYPTDSIPLECSFKMAFIKK